MSRTEKILKRILGEQVELDPPQSRIEKILYKILGEQVELEPPQSRVEELLTELANNPPGPGPTPGSDTLGDLIKNELTSYTGTGITSFDFTPFKENYTIEELSFPDLPSDTNFEIKYCGALQKVSVPNLKMSLTGGSVSFEGCYSLSEITMKAPEIVPSNGFGSCESLTNSSFDFSKLQQVYDYGFSYCTGITEMNLHYPGGNTDYDLICGPGAFSGCSGLEKVVLKSDSNTDSTFYNAMSGPIFDWCSALETLVLDVDFLFTLEYTFYDEESGEWITFKNEDLAGCFAGTPIADGNGYIYVHNSVKSQYENDDQWGQFSFRSIEDYPDVLA